MNLTRASRELFRRAPDECFPSLSEFSQHCQRQKDESREVWQPPRSIGTKSVGFDHLMLAVGEGQTFHMNDWSFGQLCRLGGVAKETVNRLSPDTAARVFGETLPRGSKPLGFPPWCRSDRGRRRSPAHDPVAMDDAPVGACILYATACGLSDAELDKTWDILVSTGKAAEDTEIADDGDSTGEDSESESSEGDTSGGSKVKLKPWNQPRGKSLGHEAPQGKAVPLIDRIHRAMHLWKDGDLHKVDEYLDQHALRRHELFKRVVQSLIELSTNSERALLESISNHIGAKGARREDPQRLSIETESAAESEGE